MNAADYMRRSNYILIVQIHGSKAEEEDLIYAVQSSPIP